MIAALDAAQHYLCRGWSVVPIPAGAKAPREPGWDSQHFTLDDLPDRFRNEINLGVRLGADSGWLADADLDCAEALALADIYLPPTQAVFGRRSKPLSHRLYIAVGAAYESFGDPLAGRKSTLIELRTSGSEGGAHQTLFPPSVADGEQREWASDIIAPHIVDAVALRTAVVWLAIGCLVFRHVSEIAARNPGPDLPSLLWEVDQVLGGRAYDWLGWPHPDAPRRQPRPHREMTHDDLDFAEMVAAISNAFDWAEWNAVGMAIFAATGGSQDGFIAFDDLSARSPKYDPHTVDERWRNYRRSPPSRTGMGKLISLALAAGWRPSRRGTGR